MENKKLKIELSNGYKIVAEVYNDGTFPEEMCVYIESPDGKTMQDICMVGEKYDVVETEIVCDSNKVSCRVWGDAYSEDYTEDNCIEIYKGEEF